MWHLLKILTFTMYLISHAKLDSNLGKLKLLHHMG